VCRRVIAEKSGRALVALVLQAKVPELAGTIVLTGGPCQRDVDAVDDKERVHARGVNLQERTRNTGLEIRREGMPIGAECTRVIVEANLCLVWLAPDATVHGIEIIMTRKAQAVCPALHRLHLADLFVVLAREQRTSLAMRARNGAREAVAIRVVQHAAAKYSAAAE